MFVLMQKPVQIESTYININDSYIPRGGHSVRLSLINAGRKIRFSSSKENIIKTNLYPIYFYYFWVILLLYYNAVCVIKPISKTKKLYKLKIKFQCAVYFKHILARI